MAPQSDIVSNRRRSERNGGGHVLPTAKRERTWQWTPDVRGWREEERREAKENMETDLSEMGVS